VGADRYHLLDTDRLYGPADLYPFQPKVKLNCQNSNNYAMVTLTIEIKQS
jgi:hypothetical protein